MLSDTLSELSVQAPEHAPYKMPVSKNGVDYPRDIQARIENGVYVALIADSQRAPQANACQNCANIRKVFYFVPSSGLRFFPSPLGKAGEKWAEMQDGRRGWVQGQIETADCPVCSNGNSAYWYKQNCGLSGNDLLLTANEFVVTGLCAEKKPALDTILALRGQGKSPGGFATLHGAYGVGKSMLLKILVNSFCAIEVRALYARMSDILADIRDNYSDERGTVAVSEAIKAYQRIRVLCIDEFDRVSFTSWAQEVAFKLLDARYNDRANLLTVLASNKAPGQLPPELGYLKSRMSGGQVIEVGGVDMRGIGV